MSESAEIDILRMFVEAHDQPHPGMGERIQIMYLKHSGGTLAQARVFVSAEKRK